MKKIFSVLIVALLFFGSAYALNLPVGKITRVATLRENQLVGYGIVVGLPGSGDSRVPLASESLKKLLQHRGIELSREVWNSRNMAAVMVMAKVPAFARPGDKIDIWVSSIGDARSLSGGYLIQTPLGTPAGETYAVAQAALASPVESRGGQNINTIYVPDGASMERAIEQPLIVEENGEPVVRLRLLDFNVSTAGGVVEAINKEYPKSASLENSGTIRIVLRDEEEKEKPSLQVLREMFELKVKVEPANKVVVDPRSGSVVMGGNVGISAVSVSRADIQVRILQGTRKNDEKKIQMVEESATVGTLVEGLNELGVSAKEIIEILRAIHAAGALHGELVIL